jgi:hypothetical protein
MAQASDDTAPWKQFVSPEAIRAMQIIRLREEDLAGLLRDAQVDIKVMTGALGA